MSLVKSNLPCELCGSSDAAALYHDTDGVTRKYCFSCGKVQEDGKPSVLTPSLLYSIGEAREKSHLDLRKLPTLEQLQTIKMVAPAPWVKSRGYDVDTAALYRSGEVSLPGIGKARIFPLIDRGEIIAAKVKLPDKSQATVGRYNQLYGKHTANNTWNLVITEGEEDAEAARFALGSHYACVSVPNGANGALKVIQSEYEWICQFDKIYLCFDNDTQGIEAVKRVINVLPKSKTYVVTLPNGYKDVCEALKDGNKVAIKQAIYNAQTYVEPGFLSPEDMSTHVLEWLKGAQDAPSTGFPGLDKLIKGVRGKEITVLTGGTGSSKSTVCRVISNNLAEQGIKSLLLSLEDSMESSVVRLLETKLNGPVFNGEIPDTQLQDLIKELSEQILIPKITEHTVPSVVSKIEYAVQARGCKVVFIDHLTIIAESVGGTARHSVVEELMASLRRLANNLDIHIFVVSHVSKDNDDSDDTSPSLVRLKHSGAIAQVADTVLGIYRKRDSQICTIKTLKAGRNWGEFGEVSLCYNGYRYEEFHTGLYKAQEDASNSTKVQTHHPQSTPTFTGLTEATQDMNEMSTEPSNEQAQPTSQVTELDNLNKQVTEQTEVQVEVRGEGTIDLVPNSNGVYTVDVGDYPRECWLRMSAIPHGWKRLVILDTRHILERDNQLRKHLARLVAERHKKDYRTEGTCQAKGLQTGVNPKANPTGSKRGVLPNVPTVPKKRKKIS